ncbi:MAG: hypothetical protein NVSMB8_05490 [Candidatus Limnocylindrales bacterium]
MRTPDDRLPSTPETERLERPGRVERVERVERVSAPTAAPAGQVNVNAGRSQPVWTVTRVIVLLFTVLEIVLLVRFIMKFAAANPDQPLVAALYGATEPLVRPFQGIFPAVTSPVVVDIPALLSILFLFGIAALIVALVRAVAGRTSA